jgi:hypothetical protein
LNAVTKLLITGTMSRSDIVQTFERLEGSAELTFVEYEGDWGQGIDRSVYEGKGRLVTWEESRSADAVLRSVKPDRVVFLFTSSINQVALRVAAREQGIETVHVEHGYRLPAADSPGALTTAHRPGGRRLGDRRTHLFFARSVMQRRPSAATALARYAAKVTRTGGTPEVLREFADLRRPDRYVSYSQECFTYHRDVDRIPDRVADATVFTGVPQFDDFRIADGHPVTGEVLLIDHQFHNSGLFGWSDDFRRGWVREVAQRVFAAGAKRLHVRLHPGDVSRAWDPLLSTYDIQIAPRSALPELALRVPIVLGTFSTMQLPFAALPHVAMISLEIHPQPSWFPSRRMAEAGVVEPVRTYDELTKALELPDDLLIRQQPKKGEFTTRFLERLDGGAAHRVARSLL